MTETRTAPSAICGYLGFLIGAAALILVLVHFWAGPFAPQQETSVTIGEIAAEMRQSAVRALKGEPQPAPVAEPWDIDRWLKVAAGALAGLALILGVGAFVRHESRRPALAGVVLGGGAIVFQVLTWSILLVIGCLLYIAIMENMGGILGE